MKDEMLGVEGAWWEWSVNIIVTDFPLCTRGSVRDIIDIQIFVSNCFQL